MKPRFSNGYGIIRVTAMFLAWTTVLFSMSGMLLSCDRTFLPKPLGYNRLDLPEPSYRPLPDTFPYTFEYSEHALLLDDTSRLNERYWIKLYYPLLKSNIHITYKRLNGDARLLKEL